MDLQEHRNIVNQLLSMVTSENQATASELLTTLSEDYNETTTLLSEATKSVNDLTVNNEVLRDVNAKLFLKVGTTETLSKGSENIPNVSEQENEIETKSFDDLFNEKGELI